MELASLDVPLLSPTDRLVELPPLRLRDASTGARPRLATTVRVGLRNRGILVRFDGRDDGVVATFTRRDESLWNEDVFEVFLSPQDPPAIYYEFVVNPLGTLYDAMIESPDLRRQTMRVHASWNCPGFRARVRQGQAKWSTLFWIPLEPLDPNGEARHWRANFYRIDRGETDEYTAWCPTGADPPDFHVPERFGYLDLAGWINDSMTR